MKDVLSVGLIGAGSNARGHARVIENNDNIRLAAVMDIDRSRAEALADEHNARAYGVLDDLLNDSEVDAVHVCSIHKAHAEQVVAAARAGKHVLVEKPMALSVAECDLMIAACEDAGVVLMVGQVMRHFPVNLRVKGLIREGAIGEVGHMIRRRYSNFDPPDRSWYLNLELGGVCVLYCFGPHEYDILPWYIDSPVVKVYSQGSESAERYAGQKDSYSTIMTHKDGAVSVLTQTVVTHTGAHDTYIMGSEGSIWMTNQKLMVNGKEVPIDETSQVGMPNQIGEFADCCLNGKVPDANGRSVRHTMAVIEAAKLSAECGEPVMISNGEDA